MLALALLAFSCGFAPAQGEEPDRFEKLQASYKKELQRVTQTITGKYLAALAELQEGYGRAGNLQNALEVREEKEKTEAMKLGESDVEEEPAGAAGADPSAEDTGPKLLTSLRDSFQRAMKRATTPVDKIYLDALIALQKRYTIEGNLEAALAVRAERDRFDPAKAAEMKAVEDLREFLSVVWDRDKDHLFVDFAIDGTVTHRWGNSEKIHWDGGDGKWEVKDGEITMTEFRNGTPYSTWKVEKKGRKKIRISPIEITGKDWISGDFDVEE